LLALRQKELEDKIDKYKWKKSKRKVPEH